MTHDELITYIDDSTNGLKHEHLFEKLLANTKALRAVVELHKPYQHEVVSYVFCKGCTIDLDLAPPYPCETIQTIERELNGQV
jgi:hypothetical protein